MDLIAKQNAIISLTIPIWEKITKYTYTNNDMTDERKNEIWAMLPEKEQIEFQKAYDVMYECESYDMGFKDALERVFGYDNLTAQAEEKTKEPKFKVGDKVIVNGRFISEIDEINTNGYPNYPYHIQKLDGYYGFFAESDLEPYITQNAEISDSSNQNCTIPTENGISNSKIQSESAKSVETSTKDDAYFAYRLDLAKEIAVRLIDSSDKDPHYVGVFSKVAVEMANEIVKLLKETEE